MQGLEVSGAVRPIDGSLGVERLNCNFSKENNMLPEDDRMFETFRSLLSVLM